MSKTALITGTTSGIGLALCNKFASEKINLILVARDRQRLQEQQVQLEQKGIHTEIIVSDLSIPNAAKLIYDEVCKREGWVDLLVNNAGFNEAGDFLETDIREELKMIQVHISFLTELTKYFLPGMITRGYGKILNLASTGAYMPCPKDTVYAASKAYVLSFSNALFEELRGTGVSVTSLCPGATRTSFAKKADLEKTLLFKWFVMEPAQVAEIGYQSLMKGKRTVTAGFYNKMLVMTTKLLPVRMLNPITRIMVSR